MRARRWIATTALAAASALVLAGCSAPSSGPGGAGSTAGRLTILTSQTQINLDPARSQSLADTSSGLVLRRLTTWRIRPGEPAKVVPDLATTTGTPSDGGRVWTYTLKPGLKMSDGKPITSQEIKYGVERSFAPELSGGLGYHKSLLAGASHYRGPYTDGSLSSIQTPDPHTIVFHLDAPYGDWPWIVSMPAFAPVPKSADDPQTYGLKPVASGPYKVASNRNGTAMVLKRNPYWKRSSDPVRTAGPRTIVFEESQDPATSTQSLIADAGSARTSFLADILGAAQLNLVNQNPQAKSRLATSQAGPLTYLAMNTQRGALRDVQVRKAIEYAVDTKAFIVAQGGPQAAVRATTLITPGIAGRLDYDLYPSGPDGDVSKAKKLLGQAGHASGLSLVLWAANDSATQAEAQAVQQGLARAGITVTIKPMDKTTMITQATTEAHPDYDLILGSWQPDFPSANSNIQPLFASDQIGDGGFDLARYSNPAVDRMIDAAQAQVDPARAQQEWARTDKRIMQDAPVVPLTYAKQSFLRGSAVQHFFIADFPAYPNYLVVSLGR